MTYHIELQEKYNKTKYPRFILLDDIYFTFDDAKKARDEWKEKNPNSNYFPNIRAF